MVAEPLPKPKPDHELVEELAQAKPRLMQPRRSTRGFALKYNNASKRNQGAL